MLQMHRSQQAGDGFVVGRCQQKRYDFEPLQQVGSRSYVSGEAGRGDRQPVIPSFLASARWPWRSVQPRGSQDISTAFELVGEKSVVS